MLNAYRTKGVASFISCNSMTSRKRENSFVAEQGKVCLGEFKLRNRPRNITGIYFRNQTTEMQIKTYFVER